MANEKDVTEKTLEAYNDVFADIVNVLLFNGRSLVKEDELEKESERTHYKFENEIHEQERDVAKFWIKSQVRIAIVGLENQTVPDKYMPVRVIGYDGASYRGQLTDVDEHKRIKGVYPTITLVLYFGRTRWNKALRLSEVLEVPPELKEYFNDYKINLFEISFLSRKQVDMFQSDFKIVADYFVQTRENDDYNPPDTVIRHVHEVLELMTAVTKDDRFEETVREYNKDGGGNKMGEAALDKIEARGEVRGRQKERIDIIERALRKGNTPKAVSEFNDIPLEEVLSVQRTMSAVVGK